MDWKQPSFRVNKSVNCHLQMNFYWEYSTVTPRLDEDEDGDEATAAAALVIYGHKLEH